MTDFLISYKRPLGNSYNVRGGEIGIVERMLGMLGGQVFRSTRGPSTTIGYRAAVDATPDQIKETLRASLNRRVGRACLVEVATNGKAWAWPTSEDGRTSTVWETLFK